MSRRSIWQKWQRGAGLFSSSSSHLTSSSGASRQTRQCPSPLECIESSGVPVPNMIIVQRRVCCVLLCVQQQCTAISWHPSVLADWKGIHNQNISQSLQYLVHQHIITRAAICAVTCGVSCQSIPINLQLTRQKESLMGTSPPQHNGIARQSVHIREYI